jgi:undecaprenyl-diphosphatase
VLHVGTAVALLLYFRRDWIGLARGLVRPSADGGAQRHLLGLLIVGTVPAAVVGLLLEKPLRILFGTPPIAALFLIVNGALLFGGERLRRRAAGTSGLGALGWRGAFFVGIWQCTALIPGISRSGATMVGGLLAGLRHDEAARFSFLLATPVIAGAAVLEAPKLLHHGAASLGPLSLIVGAGIVAGVTAYLSTAFLMRYFRRHEVEALDPFAYYCWIAGAAALFLLTMAR